MRTRHILFISKGIDSASTRYRALQFFPYFHDEGFTTEHLATSGGLLAILKILWQAPKADIVVVIRKTFPAIVTWLLRLRSKCLIFDLDDAIFCRSNGLPSKTRMKRFANIARVSDHIFAGNQFLVENALRFNDRVTLIPTCLDVANYKIDVDKPNDFFDLVWIGSKSTSKYLIDVLPILEKLAIKYPKLRLKIVADCELPDTAIPVLVVPWSETNEIVELATSQIGIAPMIDNNWTRGKCALKVLQYMAANLPVVSSNVGVNAEVVISGETGYLVSTSKQWTEAIEDLYLNELQSTVMGVAGNKRIVEYYDINIVFQRILTILGAESCNP